MKNLFLLLLFLPTVTMAQFDISLQVGGSSAVGDYGSTSGSDAMYAGNGINANVWLGWRVTDYLGVTVGLTGSTNNTQDVAFAKDQGVPVVNFTMDDQYTNVGVMAGLYLAAGSDRIKFTTRLAGGVTSFNDADYIVRDNGNSLWVEHYESESLGWLIQPGVDFWLADWVSLGGYFSYFRSSFEVDYEVYVNNTIDSRGDYNPTVEHINYGFSLNFHF